MTYGKSVVMIGNEWSDDHRSPKSLGGKTTQIVHVQLAEGEDIDAYCAHARPAGAEILTPPETQFYGDRTYRARDPEGHIWSFAVTTQRMTPEQWDKASGFTTKARLDCTKADKTIMATARALSTSLRSECVCEPERPAQPSVIFDKSTPLGSMACRALAPRQIMV